MAGTSEKMSQNEIARRGWEWQNSVQPLRNVDDLFRYNEEEHQRMMSAKPWEKDVNFFKTCRISALALLKMVMHARSGGNLEVMGLMLGRADAGSMIVMDAFALPVEGTETRVNAQAQAYEYMTQYMDTQKAVGRIENVIGWYHSHPGYGCWLSGIDVETQRLNQTYQEPWLAVVIDPIRTIAAGQVDLGAFRTYPKGYLPAEEKDNSHRSIPLKKVEDFGTHYKEYYQLAVSYFKTSSDKRLLNQLWNQYWVATLSSSPWFKNLSYNIEQTEDVAEKLKQSLKDVQRESFGRSLWGGGEPSDAEGAFHKAVKDGRKVSCEAMHAVMTQIIKKSVFNDFETTGASPEEEAAAMSGSIALDFEEIGKEQGMEMLAEQAAPEEVVKMEDSAPSLAAEDSMSVDETR